MVPLGAVIHRFIYFVYYLELNFLLKRTILGYADKRYDRIKVGYTGMFQASGTVI